MAQATFHFPRGFLWGTATAAHQVEGNNTNNDWWAWEQQPGHIVQGQKSGLADDWWGGRWREDFDRAAEGGQNAHRLSVEWSRIQPTPQHWDESALDHYREIVRGLLDRNMTPMVTLHHFTSPLWMTEMGGWENEAIVDYFVPFVRKVVEALKEYCNLWVTINEPNVLATAAYALGEFPPGRQDLRATFNVMGNMVKAHAQAYHAIHEEQPTARVGMAVNYHGFEPARSWLPLDRWVAGIQSNLFNNFFPEAASSGVLRFPLWRRRMPEAKGTQDFLGLNYYTRDYVAFDLRKAGQLFGRRFYLPGADLSDTGFIANAPQGMFEAIKWGLNYDLPIIITENGVEDADDDLRPRYLVQHLHQVWRAVNFNFPVKGYFHWTLVDNFEWERGWTQRFGLWELDVETQARRKRASAELYAGICQENGISSELVAKYAPEIFDSMFPG
ncbi:MAG: glycoside hydrolase family 1 protein [Anaerolineales bacterium]|jgi:beta-glucosidase